jgi:hypothetical protein
MSNGVLTLFPRIVHIIVRKFWPEKLFDTDDYSRPSLTGCSLPEIHHIQGSEYSIWADCRIDVDV